MQRIIEASYALVNAERITLFSVDPLTKELGMPLQYFLAFFCCSLVSDACVLLLQFARIFIWLKLYACVRRAVCKVSKDTSFKGQVQSPQLKSS